MSAVGHAEGRDPRRFRAEVAHVLNDFTDMTADADDAPATPDEG